MIYKKYFEAARRVIEEKGGHVGLSATRPYVYRQPSGIGECVELRFRSNGRLFVSVQQMSGDVEQAEMCMLELKMAIQVITEVEKTIDRE